MIYASMYFTYTHMHYILKFEYSGDCCNGQYDKGVQIKTGCWCHRIYLYGSLDALDKSVSITKEDYEEFVPV